jgi:hypothetical protein
VPEPSLNQAAICPKNFDDGQLASMQGSVIAISFVVFVGLSGCVDRQHRRNSGGHHVTSSRSVLRVRTPLASKRCRTAGSSSERHRVRNRGADDAFLPTGVSHPRLQFADRIVSANIGDSDMRRDRLAKLSALEETQHTGNRGLPTPLNVLQFALRFLPSGG